MLSGTSGGPAAQTSRRRAEHPRNVIFERLRRLLAPAAARPELPQYRCVRGVKTLVAPDDLLEREWAVLSSPARAAREAALLGPPHRPDPQDPLLFVIGRPDAAGLKVHALGADDGFCVPVFSTAVRAAEFKRVLTAVPAGMAYYSVSPTELLEAFAGHDEGGPRRYAFDPCPHCATAAAIDSSSLREPDDVIKCWAMSRASTELRAQLYLQYTLDAAYRGDFRLARYVGLCGIVHVTSEEPQLHLLLGHIGVALGHTALIRDAQQFLAFLGRDALAAALEDARLEGVPNLSMIRTDSF